MSKQVNFEKNIKFDHSLIVSWLRLSSLLVRCVKDVACKSSHNNFYKQNEQFILYMLNVIYM
jgi:hypothetical protein